MSKAEVEPGNCGYTTIIEAKMAGDDCQITIQSACPYIQKLAADLGSVDPYHEISFRRGTPQILQAGAKYCKHSACPVPVAVIKAVEVEANLALPSDVTIKLSK
jgi:hypothetical protein